MKFVLRLVAFVALGALVATAVRAQGNAPANACIAIGKRLLRQDRIDTAYNCATLEGRTARLRAGYLHRCQASDRSRLDDLADERAEALERCVARHLASQREPARNDTDQQNGSRSAAYRLDARGAERRAENAREAAGKLIRDLLASGPKPIRADSGTSEASVRAHEFRSGLVWSYGGKIAGMHCVQWREPSDPHDWFDNYLCTERDVGFQWSFRGPILGRGLKCIQVNEKSDPHDWHDNYFCWPRDLDISFRFSSSGRLPGYRCIAIVEPSDPHTWRDNYLCHRGRAG